MWLVPVLSGATGGLPASAILLSIPHKTLADKLPVAPNKDRLFSMKAGYARLHY